MAIRSTLAERIKKRTRDTRSTGGDLAQEDIQNLSASKGLEAAPLSPASAAGIGASPDQAKMVGDARQKRAALQQSIDPDDTLTGRLRRGQARKDATGAEYASKEKSQSLQALRGLGDRVQNMVGKYMAPEVLTAEATPELTPEALTLGVPAQEALAVLTTNYNQDTLEAAAKALNLSYPSFDPNDINKYFTSDPKGQTIAQQISDTVDVTSLVGELGFTDTDGNPDMGQLAALLGVDPASITSIDELQNAVDKATEEEFRRTENLKDVIYNPNASPAERQAAMDQLKDLGSVGVRATEVEVDELWRAIDEADIVEFGGEEYEYGELLSNETISGLVKEYLEAGPERQQVLRDLEPGFFGFVDQNKAALSDQIALFEGEATTFGETQEANNALADVAVLGTRIPDEFMKEVFPQWGEFSAEQFDAADMPIFAKLSDEKWVTANSAKAQTLMENMTFIANMNPTAAAELAHLSEDELEELGIFSDSTEPLEKYSKDTEETELTPAGRWAMYQDNLRTKQELEEAGEDPDKILSTVFGKDITAKEVEDLLDDERAMAAAGLGDTTLADLLDRDRDGKLDDPATLKANLAEAYTTPALKDVLAGKISSLDTTGYGEWKSSNTDTAAKNVFLKYAGDGEFTLADAIAATKELATSGATDGSSLSDLINLTKDREIRTVLEQKMLPYQQRNYDKLFVDNDVDQSDYDALLNGKLTDSEILSKFSYHTLSEMLAEAESKATDFPLYDHEGKSISKLTKSLKNAMKKVADTGDKVDREIADATHKKRVEFLAKPIPGLLTADQKWKYKQELKRFTRKTGYPTKLVTVKNSDGTSYQAYAAKVKGKWVNISSLTEKEK